MNLVLKVINNPDISNYSEQYVFSKIGGTIGSNPNSTWVLPDKNSSVSDTHLEISYSDKKYYLFDISTEGTYYKHNNQKVEKRELVQLHENEILIIGIYEIEVTFYRKKEETKGVLKVLNKREIDMDMDDNIMLKNHHDSPLNVILKEKAVEKDILSYLNIIPEEEDPFGSSGEESEDDTLSQHITLPSFDEAELEISTDEISSSPVKNDELSTLILSILSQKLGLDMLKLDASTQIKVISEFGDMFLALIDGINLLEDNVRGISKKLKVEETNSKKGFSKITLMDLKNGKKISKNICTSVDNILNHHTALYTSIEKINLELSKEFSPNNLENELKLKENDKKLFSSSKNFWNLYVNKYSHLNKLENEGKLTQEIIKEEYKKTMDTLLLSKGKI